MLLLMRTRLRLPETRVNLLLLSWFSTHLNNCRGRFCDKLRMTGVVPTFAYSILARKSQMSSLKRNKNIHKEEDVSYYIISANRASSVTLL